MSQLQKKIYILFHQKKIFLDDIISSDTIEIIKKKIWLKIGLKIELQRLIFAGKALLDDKTVSDYNIPDEATLLLIKKPEYIQIILKDSNREINKYLIEKNEKIEYLKNIIYDKEGINPENQILFFGEKELKNNKIISDYGIQEESIIYLQIKIESENKEITIILNMPKGRTINIFVTKKETIKNLKFKIYDKEGINPENQILFFGEKELENNKNISDYGIQNKSIISLNINQQMQIFVKMINYIFNNNDYITLTFDVNEFEKIEDIKNKIQKKTKINSKDQILIFAGKQLEDFKTLKDYKIGNDDIIYLVQRKTNLNDIYFNQCILNYKTEKKIRLFGKNFCKNNKKNCHLVINGKKTELLEFYEDKNHIQNYENINVQLIINEKITDLSFMFSDCYSLLDIIGISKWNTSSITKMNNIFS